jgi:hypothetical protein
LGAANLLNLFALTPVHGAIGYRGASRIERTGDSRVGEPFIKQRTHSSLERFAEADRMLAQVLNRFRLQERGRRAPRRQMIRSKNRFLRANFLALALRSSVHPELAIDAADVSPRVQGSPNRLR